MMFPYSHMTLAELHNAALDAGGLAAALAEKYAEALQEQADSLYTQEQVDKLREEMGDEADAEENRADAAEAELESAQNRIDAALLLIPDKTSHKGLIAIREALKNAE